jgi:hypothetical protein
MTSEGNVPIQHVSLSKKAGVLMESCLAIANRGYLEGIYDGQAPKDCPFIATCATLVVVDNKAGDTEEAEEIRGVYNNGSCITTCPLNVLNPGCLPDSTISVASYDPPRFPGGSD